MKGSLRGSFSHRVTSCVHHAEEGAEWEQKLARGETEPHVGNAGSSASHKPHPGSSPFHAYFFIFHFQSKLSYFGNWKNMFKIRGKK